MPFPLNLNGNVYTRDQFEAPDFYRNILPFLRDVSAEMQGPSAITVLSVAEDAPNDEFDVLVNAVGSLEIGVWIGLAAPTLPAVFFGAVKSITPSGGNFMIVLDRGPLYKPAAISNVFTLITPWHLFIAAHAEPVPSSYAWSLSDVGIRPTESETVLFEDFVGYRPVAQANPNRTGHSSEFDKFVDDVSYWNGQGPSIFAVAADAANKGPSASQMGHQVFDPNHPGVLVMATSLFNEAVGVATLGGTLHLRNTTYEFKTCFCLNADAVKSASGNSALLRVMLNLGTTKTAITAANAWSGDPGVEFEVGYPPAFVGASGAGKYGNFIVGTGWYSVRITNLLNSGTYYARIEVFGEYGEYDSFDVPVANVVAVPCVKWEKSNVAPGASITGSVYPPVVAGVGPRVAVLDYFYLRTDRS